MRTFRLLVAIATLACCPSLAIAAPFDFLLTPGKVTVLAIGAELKPGAKADQKALQALLPGYEFETGYDEGEVLFVDRKDNGQGGIELYLGDANEIIEIAGGPGVIDSMGATRGTRFTDVYKSKVATCSTGLLFSCESDFSTKIGYSVDFTGCPASVPVHTGNDDATTGKFTVKIDPCMKVESIFLDP
jgi:hypothetical protein